MSRVNFYELLDSMELDYRAEYARLLRLFSEEHCIWLDYSSCTLCNYVQYAYFRKLKFRATFTTVEEMLSRITLPTKVPRNINDLFLLCEFLMAVLPKEFVEKNSKAKEQADCIIENIYRICDKANYEIQKIADKKIIVEKSKESMQAVDLVSDKNTAIKIIEYNHYALKGQLQKKKEILNELSQYIEPELKAHTLKKGGYQQLESDIGFLLNNFHIRHNNKEGSKAQEYIVALKNNDLEKWYDKCYNSILSAIIIIEQMSISTELKELKDKYTWKT